MDSRKSSIRPKQFFRARLLSEDYEEVMKYLSDLVLNQEEIEKGLWEIVINIPNVTYDLLLNIPVTKRDTLISVWNRKIQKEKKQ